MFALFVFVDGLNNKQIGARSNELEHDMIGVSALKLEGNIR